MRTIFAAPLVIALVVPAISCKPLPPPETEVRGDVFVVTKGGQNVKLGLVNVRFIPESVISPVVSAQMTLAESMVRGLRNSLQQAKDDAADAALSVKTQKSILDFAEMGRDVSRKLGGKHYTDYVTKYEKQHDAYLASLHRKLDALKAYEQLARRMERYENGCFFADAVPQTVHNDKTDADGRFSLKLGPGRYAAVAVSDRQVGKEQETYCWYVWTTVAGEPTKKLMLSNDNLADTKCADCLLPLAQLASQAGATPVTQADAGVTAASAGQ